MKPLVHVIYLAVIMALASYIWFQPSPSVSVQAPLASNAELSSAQHQVVSDQLPNEVAVYIEELELEIVNLRRALQTEIAAKAVSHSEDREGEPPSNRASESQDGNAAQPFGGRPFMDTRDVNALFEEESIDPEWSTQHEQRLVDLMITDEGLRKYSVGDVECKSNMCRLKFYDSIEDPSAFTRDLSRAVFQSNWEEQRFMTILQQAEGNEELTVFLKKME